MTRFFSATRHGIPLLALAMLGFAGWSVASKYRPRVVTSSAFCYLMLEIGYRFYQYETLPRRLFEILWALQSDGPAANDQYIFDANVGFRYAPNFTGERGSPWFSHWRTNQWGHVSRSDYPQHKPMGGISDRDSWRFVHGGHH